MENKHIIGLFVHNHPGVLLRVTSLISRRGFNIDSLTASPAAVEGYSRMTIRLSGDDDQVEQFINQMMKIVDVKNVEALPDDSSAASELKEFGIMEMARTGIAALENGDRCLNVL